MQLAVTGRFRVAPIRLLSRLCVVVVVMVVVCVYVCVCMCVCSLKIDRIVYRIVSPYRFENDTKTIRFDEMDRIVLPRLMHRIVSYRFSYRFSYRNDTRHVRGTAVEFKT
jgi:hypothetical protein